MWQMSQIVVEFCTIHTVLITKTQQGTQMICSQISKSLLLFEERIDPTKGYDSLKIKKLEPEVEIWNVSQDLERESLYVREAEVTPLYPIVDLGKRFVLLLLAFCWLHWEFKFPRPDRNNVEGRESIYLHIYSLTTRYLNPSFVWVRLNFSFGPLIIDH